jgi:hypothetical protein
MKTAQTAYIGMPRFEHFAKILGALPVIANE